MCVCEVQTEAAATESSGMLTSKSTKTAVELANITVNHLRYLNQSHCDPLAFKTL